MKQSKICPDCKIEKPLTEFYERTDTHTRPRCLECQRAVWRERSKRFSEHNPEARRRAANRWNQSPKGRRARRKYRASDRGRQERRRYRVSPQGKHVQRRYLMRLKANLPTPVLRPYVERLVLEFDGSVCQLARAIGVDEATLRRILGGTRRSVQLITADRIALYADCSLPELHDRAKEWAFLVGDSWPEGYWSSPKRRRGIARDAPMR